MDQQVFNWGLPKFNPGGQPDLARGGIDANAVQFILTRIQLFEALLRLRELRCAVWARWNLGCQK